MKFYRIGVMSLLFEKSQWYYPYIKKFNMIHDENVILYIFVFVANGSDGSRGWNFTKNLQCKF